MTKAYRAFLLSIVACAAAANGAILLTEFMPDPAGTDADREWIEIYNSGVAPVDISGWRIGDAPTAGQTSAGEGLFAFPAGTVMPASEVWVIAQKAVGGTGDAFFGLYGFKPDFEMAADTDPTVPNLIRDEAWSAAPAGTNFVAIANGNDDVVITDPDHNWIDGASYGTNTTFFTGLTYAAGRSFERVPAHVDTDTAADWILHATSAESTPGVVIPEPTGLAVLAGVLLLAVRRRR